jgi:hypothetical protein
MSQKLNSEFAVIGIDIGKNSFHLVGPDRRGSIVLRQKWSRGQVEARLANLQPFTRCLRCAGAPRRSPSGSELSLRVLSWHAVPCDPGEPDHRSFQSAMSAWPSPRPA